MPKEDNNELVISFLKIRRLIGLLGILLPGLCLLINYVFIKYEILDKSLFVTKEWSACFVSSMYCKPTISDYFYSPATVVFTGILITVSVFLFCYHGYKEKSGIDKFPFLTDNLMTNIAAISLLGVAIFPTQPKNEIKDNVFAFTSSEFIGTLHFICAIIFFISISLLCIINFRRTGKSRDFGNEMSDKIYLFCGIGMLIMIICMSIYVIYHRNRSDINSDSTFFWLETVALILFGFAWLVKGKIYKTKMAEKIRNIF